MAGRSKSVTHRARRAFGAGRVVASGRAVIVRATYSAAAARSGRNGRCGAVPLLAEQNLRTKFDSRQNGDNGQERQTHEKAETCTHNVRKSLRTPPPWVQALTLLGFSRRSSFTKSSHRRATTAKSYFS